MRPWLMLMLAALAACEPADVTDSTDRTDDTEPLVVNTTKGALRGVVDGDSVAYLGVPFAAPPTGERRWRQPEPADDWEGVRDAAAFAEHCTQADGEGGSGWYGSEDCLYLNVWRPAGAPPDAALPVMVYVHGGGRDANALWTCNTPPDLFSAVAIHSAPLGLDPLPGLRERTQDLLAEVGCDDAPEGALACLRDAPADALVTAEAARPRGLASGAFIPTVDGTLCTRQPSAVVQSGNAADVPVVLGTTENEYSHRWSGFTDASYPARVRAAVGAEYADAVLEQYPLSRYPSATVAYTEMMSDRNVTCPHRRYARMIAATGGTAYHYRFRQRLPDGVGIGYGVYHTSDILYLFRHMDGASFDVTDGDVAAQDAMTRYWTRFAATGDPSGGEDPTWPAYAFGDERSLALDATPTIASDIKKEDCDFWDGLLRQ